MKKNAKNAPINGPINFKATPEILRLRSGQAQGRGDKKQKKILISLKKTSPPPPRKWRHQLIPLFQEGLRGAEIYGSG